MSAANGETEGEGTGDLRVFGAQGDSRASGGAGDSRASGGAGGSRASGAQGDSRASGAGGELRSFGRRRGRKISSRQSALKADLLPRVGFDLASPAPQDAGALFSPAVPEVWLEIGFGGAEHLIWQAKANAGSGLIGCEPFEEGVVKALAAIDQDRLANVRLWPDDVRPLLRWLPAQSLSRVFILFPDPWPKKRHQKRRLFSTELLKLLARVMKPGAELRLATDIGDYARTALLAVAASPAFRWTAEGPQDWRVRPSDWPGTRYEAKAVREGRCRYFFRFVRSPDG